MLFEKKKNYFLFGLLFASIVMAQEEKTSPLMMMHEPEPCERKERPQSHIEENEQRRLTDPTNERQEEVRDNGVLAVQEGASAAMMSARTKVCFAEALKEVREFSIDEDQRMRSYNKGSKLSPNQKAWKKIFHEYSNFLKHQQCNIEEALEAIKQTEISTFDEPYDVYKAALPHLKLELRKFLKVVQKCPSSQCVKAARLLAEGAISFLNASGEAVDLEHVKPFKVETPLENLLPYRVVAATSLKEEDLKDVNIIDGSWELLKDLEVVRSLFKISNCELKDFYLRKKKESIDETKKALEQRSFFLKAKLDQRASDFCEDVTALFYNLDALYLNREEAFEFKECLRKQLFNDSDPEQLKQLKQKYYAVCQRLDELDKQAGELEKDEIDSSDDEESDEDEKKIFRKTLLFEISLLVEKVFKQAKAIQKMYASRRLRKRYINLDWIVEAANKASSNGTDFQQDDLPNENEGLLEEALQQMQRPLDQFLRMEHEHQYLKKLLRQKQQAREQPDGFSDNEENEEELQQELAATQEELLWLKDFLTRNKNSCLEKMNETPEAEKLREEFSKKYAEQVLKMRDKIVKQLYYFSGIHEESLELPE